LNGEDYVKPLKDFILDRLRGSSLNLFARFLSKTFKNNFDFFIIFVCALNLWLLLPKESIYCISFNAEFNVAFDIRKFDQSKMFYGDPHNFGATAITRWL
jgi:hypothetical protein